MTKLKRRAIFKRAAAILTAVCLAISLTSCGGVNVENKVVALNTITNPAENAAVHCSLSKDVMGSLAAESGLIELWVDAVKLSFSVLDKTGNRCWSALPVVSDEDEGGDYSGASVVSIDVLGGTDIYSLNSQDNSVAYSTGGCEFIQNGVIFTYNIFPDEATATKKTLSRSDIAFAVKLKITLRDGSMYLECSSTNLSNNPDAVITDLRLLNFFGAYNDSLDDDFVLVPDGSGAIIRTAVFDDSFEALSFPVYGGDAALGTGSGDGTAYIPAFGMKHASSAFAAIVTKGETAATIYADKATDSNEYNVVNAGFTLKPYVYEDNKLYVSSAGWPEGESIEMCYRFLSGKNATYSGLASACREQLIRNAVLSTRNVSSGDSLPFNLALIGTIYNKSGIAGYLRNVTDFEQAKDMLTRMKNKGISSVNLRYTGMLGGGANQKDSADISGALRRLGLGTGLQELYDYMDSQNMRLFPDIRLLSAQGGFSDSRTARNIYGDKITAEITDDVTGDVIVSSLRSPDDMGKMVNSLLKNTRSLPVSGFCLSDVGTLLYSDFASGSFSRTDAAKAISSCVSSLATNRSTMTVGCNFYTVKNADVIVELPLRANVSESGSYHSVPFIQLILHGSADYSGTPINKSGDIEEACLKCVEFGACPYYEWTYEQYGNDEVYWYDSQINSAAEFYLKASEVLSDLRTARITDHKEIDDGVFATEYDNGAVIYVNYTDSDYTVLGTVVEARDFMRIG